MEHGKPQDIERRKKAKKEAMKAHKRIMGTEAGERGPDEAVKRIQ